MDKKILSKEKENDDNKLLFGLKIPQGWRAGDLPLEEENDPIKQYEFSKFLSNNMNSRNLLQ